MKKIHIYKVFIAGVKHGKKYGPFNFNAPSLVDVLSDTIVSFNVSINDSKVRNVLGSILSAGYNYGSNLNDNEPIAPKETLKVMFENLIAGKPYLPDDPQMSYCIKEKVDELLTKK